MNTNTFLSQEQVKNTKLANQQQYRFNQFKQTISVKHAMKMIAKLSTQISDNQFYSGDKTGLVLLNNFIKINQNFNTAQTQNAQTMPVYNMLGTLAEMISATNDQQLQVQLLILKQELQYAYSLNLSKNEDLAKTVISDAYNQINNYLILEKLNQIKYVS